MIYRVLADTVVLVHFGFVPFVAPGERYNIGWAVAWSTATRAYLAAHPEVVEPIGETGPFRLFRSRHRPSFFLVGSGRVDARYDALEVTDASPDGVVLRLDCS